MKAKRFLSIFLVCVLLFAAAMPAFAAESGEQQNLLVASAKDFGSRIVAFFRMLYHRIVGLPDLIKAYYAVKQEKVQSTMNQNAIHMLQ